MTALGGCVLIVDDDEMFRQSVAEQVQRCGVEARVAANYDEALAQAAQADQVRVVLLDQPSPRIDLREPINQIRASCPDAVLVGNSGCDRRAEFAELGVHRFLPKPWRLGDLASLFRRVGACVGCEQPLPLRNPGAYEEGEHWVCTSCGARYYALFDESTPQSCWRTVVRAAD